MKCISMTVNEFAQAYAAFLKTKAKCPDPCDVDFHCADLTNMYLPHIVFRGINLRGVNFEGAVLYYADFYGADLGNACFRNADLWRADLRGANVVGATFEDANVDGLRVRFLNRDLEIK